MPIVMSSAELTRIKRWTASDRDDPEMVQRRELVRYQDETSRNMTKTWPNSLENVNKRNEELRQARIQAAEQANANFYKRYVKRRKEEQERLMYSARDTVFKNKDAPKLLLSAVIETCIQKERMEQLKFQKARRDEAAAEKRREDDETIRKAKEWEQHQANQRRLRYEADKKHQTDILDQAHEIAERNRNEFETELKMQQLDNLKANQQMEAIKDFEEKYKANEKARIFADMARAKHEADARRAEGRARDKMDDALIHVLNQAKARVDRKRLQVETDVRKERQRVLDAISSKMQSGEEARNAKEQQMLDKARREKEDADRRRREQEAQKEADIKQDRINQRLKWERDEAQRIQDLNTQLQWDIMNRFKNVEVYEDFQDKLRDEKARKVKEYREEILRLWKEREDREARERAETRYFYGELALRKLRDADNKLLTHAAELIREARAHGRPDLPLQKSVDLYCRLNRLYPMPPLPRSLQEHFGRYRPTDGSAPEPEYRAPPRPPPDRGPDAPDEEDERNGLQEPTKPSTSKKEEKKTEENVADYKRAGKANGLQRRNAQTDLTLPSLTVVPCKTQSCACPLRFDQ